MLSNSTTIAEQGTVHTSFSTLGTRDAISTLEQSLANGAALLSNSRTTTEHGTIPDSVGFKTSGTDTVINISEENLAKGAALLSNSRTTTEHWTIPSSVGFNTAGTGATITVSEESLAKGAAVLRSSKTTKEHLTFSPSISLNAGFKTAGTAAAISLSEESLARGAVVTSTSTTKSLDSTLRDPTRRGAAFTISLSFSAKSGQPRYHSLHMMGDTKGAQDSASILNDYTDRVSPNLNLDLDQSLIKKGKSEYASAGARKSQINSPIEFPSKHRRVKCTSTSNDSLTYISDECTALPGRNGQPYDIRATEKTAHRKRWIDGNRSVVDLQHTDIESRVGEKVSTEPTMLANVQSIRTRRLNDSREVCLDCGVRQITVDIDSTNATRLLFDQQSGSPALFLGDQDLQTTSLNAIRKELFNVGINTDVVSDRWFSNHSRWIIWKLASIERRFPHEAAGMYLTFQTLVRQLKKRYNKEIRLGMRSSIRKILNKDVASSTLMILCVSHIFPAGVRVPNTKVSRRTFRSKERMIELTDGWYGVKAIIDETLSEKVENGIIQPGTKIVICNAILTGTDDGVDPLDVSYDSMNPKCPIHLILTANATRLAAWDSRLGFVMPTKGLRANHGTLVCRNISDIVPGGGIVPSIDLLVYRVFPKLFLEHQGVAGEFGGISCVLTESEDHNRRAEFEHKRIKQVESIMESVETELSKKMTDEGSEGFQVVKETDLIEYSDVIPGGDRQIMEKWRLHREKLIRKYVEEEVDTNIQDSGSLCRESTPFVTAFVKSLPSIVCQGAVLTVWNITDSQQALLREGNIVTFRNLAVKATTHEGLLQLTARETTSMHETVYHKEAHSSAGFVLRSTLRLFHHHALSRKLSRGIPVPIQKQHLDVGGLVLKVVQVGATQHRFYLTDESGLISRIDRNGILEATSVLTPLSGIQVENLQSTVFRDVRVMPYDNAENCAVAAFTYNSRFSSQRYPHGATPVCTETDYAVVGCAATALQAGTTVHAISCPRLSPVAVAIGRIVACKFTATHVEIKVDCGSSPLHSWELPHCLVKDLFAVTEHALLSLSSDKSKRLNSLTGYHKGLMTGLLLRFVLYAKKTSYEVRQLFIADEQSVAKLHSAVQRVKGQRKLPFSI